MTALHDAFGDSHAAERGRIDTDVVQGNEISASACGQDQAEFTASGKRRLEPEAPAGGQQSPSFANRAPSRFNDRSRR
jgi:hypothetical protein